MNKYPFTPTEFHTATWKHNHPYNLQNDLLKAYNFPLFFYDGDFVESAYEDRARSWGGWWPNGYESLQSRAWAYIPKEELLEALCAKWPDKNIVGFRLVRFTNVANGYPCDRLDVFGKGADTPAMEFGANIAFNDCPEAEHGRSVYGFSGYEDWLF